MGTYAQTKFFQIPECCRVSMRGLYMWNSSKSVFSFNFAQHASGLWCSDDKQTDHQDPKNLGLELSSTVLGVS